MKHIPFLILSFVGLLQLGCSVYQSDGRKFLEDKGPATLSSKNRNLYWSFDAIEIQSPCAELFEAPELSKSDWKIADFSLHPDMKVYRPNESHEFDILLHYTSAEGREFLCAFYYPDQSQQDSHLDRDINQAYQAIELLEQY